MRDLSLEDLRALAKEINNPSAKDRPIEDYDIDLSRGWRATLTRRVIRNGVIFWEFYCKSKHNLDKPPARVVFSLSLSKGFQDFIVQWNKDLWGRVWTDIVYPGLIKYLDEHYSFFKNRSFLRAFNGSTFDEIYRFIDELIGLGYIDGGQRNKLVYLFRKDEGLRDVREVVEDLIDAYEESKWTIS